MYRLYTFGTTFPCDNSDQTIEFRAYGPIIRQINKINCAPDTIDRLKYLATLASIVPLTDRCSYSLNN